MAVNRKLSRPSWNRYPARALSHQLLNPCFIAYARLAHISDTDTLPYLFPISSSSLSLFLLGKEDNILPSFFPSTFILAFYIFIQSCYPSSLLFQTFNTNGSFVRGVGFVSHLLCIFTVEFFAPVRFESILGIQRTELRNVNFRSEAKLRCEFRAFFSFLFFPFLSLFPPGCLAAFPPPESGWCPILGINRVARSVCQMLHVL